MAITNLEMIQKGKFAEAIKLCNDQINKLKDNPERALKYKNIKKDLEEAQKTLDETIEKTKNIKMKKENGEDSEKSFYDVFIKDNENAVSLFWLSEKIAQEKTAGKIDTEVDELNLSAKEINPHYDFVDKTKGVAKQFLDGKGVSKWLTRGCLAVGIGEVLSRGVTSVLAKEGIMQEAMGLFGLGKLGVSHLPTLWSSLSAGMASIWGMMPVAVVAAGGLVAFKAIPLIKRKVEQLKTKYNANHSFEKGLDELLEEQKATALEI